MNYARDIGGFGLLVTAWVYQLLCQLTSCLTTAWRHRGIAGGQIIGHDIQGGPKNWHIFVRLITSSNTDQLSFFSLSESGENL